MKYLGKIIGIICLIIVVFACETNDKGNLSPGQSSLPGMIYNTERQAVENAKIIISSKNSEILFTS